MDRLTSIHPTHMYVVAVLPLVHQLDLQQKLHPVALQLEADQEYALTMRKYHPDDTDAEILRKYEEAVAHGHAEEDKHDVPAAMAALQQPTEVSVPHHLTGCTRSSGTPLLPHELKDLWPRIFVHLTARTRTLSTELHHARVDKLRNARLDCVTDCVLHATDGQTLIGQETAIARGLQGWEDLHIFMSDWIMEWRGNDDIPPTQFFLDVARMMGLQGCLPPLISPRYFYWKASAAVAAAGYMVVQC